jgi:hypothetical protein
MKTLILSLLTVVIATPGPVLARTDDFKIEGARGRYFLVVWAYEGEPNAPRDSHSFVAFYKGDDIADGRITPATISWLPATGIIRLVGVQQGRNFTLAQTLAMACQTRKKVASWGPYEIAPELYWRGLARIRQLESRTVAYSALGLRARAVNCIKAAGDISDSPFRPGISWGHLASQSIVRHLSPFFLNGGRTDNSVASVLISNDCR